LPEPPKQGNTSWNVSNEANSSIACVLHMTITHSKDIRLLSIYDIALLLQKITDKHTWQILIERSIEFNARIGLEKAIKMAQLWTGLNLPADFIDFRKWPTASDIEYRIVPNVKNILGTLLHLNMSVSTNPLQKVRDNFRLAFPRTADIRKAYPPSRNWLLPLSYIKRWWKWIQ